VTEADYDTMTAEEAAERSCYAAWALHRARAAHDAIEAEMRRVHEMWLRRLAVEFWGPEWDDALDGPRGRAWRARLRAQGRSAAQVRDVARLRRGGVWLMPQQRVVLDV
jgi:hypothetical protein